MKSTPEQRGAAPLRPTDHAAVFRAADDLADQGRWSEAEALYRGLSTSGLKSARLHHNWGISLREMGQLDAAVAQFEQAVSLNPTYASAYLGLSQTYRALGVPQAALLAIDLAIESAPGDAAYVLERIDLLIATGDLIGALELSERITPDSTAYARARNLQAIALRQLGRDGDAIEAFSQAVAADPHFAAPLEHRANLYIHGRRFPQALKDLDALTALEPELPWLAGRRLYTAMRLFDWRDFEARRDDILRRVEEGQAVAEPLVVQYLSDSPAIQQAAARTWTQLIVRLAPPEPATLGFPSGRKIRIGYLSQDFRSHPVSYLIAEVLELHDREIFDVAAINLGPALDDPMQARLRRSADAFIDAHELSDERAADVCRQLELDIVIDLGGYTQGWRSGLYARRIAPVQLLYLGYLGTSGSLAYDYLVADHHLIDQETRSHYDEKILFLPSYQANDRQRPNPQSPADRAALGLPESGFVFCCFNNPTKITPQMLRLWIGILDQVPGSVLWLLSETPEPEGNLKRYASALGFDTDRLVFADRCSREDYLGRLAAADLFLDTLPYNAGTTASDALWVGLPVLTQRGQSFAGRMASSLLSAAGFPQLIALDEARYVEIAVELALDAERFGALRSRLRAQGQSSRLFDAPAFTRSLELGVMSALSGTCAGDIDIDTDTDTDFAE